MVFSRSRQQVLAVPFKLIDCLKEELQLMLKLMKLLRSGALTNLLKVISEKQIRKFGNGCADTAIRPKFPAKKIPNSLQMIKRQLGTYYWLETYLSWKLYCVASK